MTRSPLANAELAVMQLLWQEDCLTARQIQERLYPQATRAQHGTVQRLLQRLEDKGYVKRNAGRGINQFSAAVTQRAYMGQQLESLASKLTAGSVAPLIMHLIEENKITSGELARLRALLSEHEVKEQPA